MAANHSKSEIVLKLYARLKQSPCTIEILEAWKRKNGYQFSTRSLYRYLDELAFNLKIKGESIEVLQGEHNKKTWKLIYNKNTLELSIADIHSFYLSKIFIPSDILRQRSQSFQKIDRFFYEQGSIGKFELSADALDLKMQHSNFYEAYYNKLQQATIDQLIWAIQNKRMLILETLSSHVDNNYNQLNVGDELLPLSLQHHRGVLQLCVFNRTRKKIVIAPFDTLAVFTATNEMFNPKKYASQLNAFFDTHFGISPNISEKVYKIELEFAGSTCGFVSQFFWHNTQQFTLLKNGNTRLTLNCGVNRELVGWIFQWMNNVKVKKPLLLQRMVVNLYQQCIDGYSADRVEYQNTFLR